MLLKHERSVTIAWFLCWGILSTGWCWSAAHMLGATYDEPFYLRAGLKNWHDLNHRELLTQGTMPLPSEVQMLPLFLAELFLAVDPQEDFSAWLPVARMGTAVFWWLLLWASYRLGKVYGGITAGRLAVALVACEPVLLGHASLATTDIPFTACLLGLIAVYRSTREDPAWTRRVAFPAIWCMLAIMAKASALVFIPVCLVLVELERLWQLGWRPSRSAENWKTAYRSCRDLAIIGVIGIALVFVVCPRASRGLLFQVRHNMEGHGGSFLLGETSPTGYWYYFAAALAIKLGLPLFILLAVLLISRPHYLMNGAIVAALALLALTPSFRVQIGVRLVLPIAILAMIGVATAFARLWAEHTGHWRKVVTGGFATALICWSAASACVVWPHGICYTNELWGGTSQGYRALFDSNYDWGQGLVDLAAWQRQHPETPLNVCYFGTDPALSRLPIRSISLQSLSSPTELEKENQGCFLAVSTNFCAVGPTAPLLHNRRPFDRTITFQIYDFRSTETVSISQR